MDIFLLLLILVGFFILHRTSRARTRQLEAKLQEQIGALQAQVTGLERRLGLPSGAASPSVDLDPQAVPAALPRAAAPEPSAVLEPAPTPLAGAAAAEQPAPPPAVPAPPAPSWWDQLEENPLIHWFTGAHIVVRAGIVVLFFGIAFLLKYAADQGWLSIELRLTGAALLGLGLVYAGWYVRERRRVYALTLQGGGLGITYMTVFAAFRIYDLLPGTVAFPTLVVLGVLCALLAVLNDAKSLAVLAIAGGFAAPLLVSTGGGSHVGLFTYFAILNAAILGIAWFKAWRELNLVGFAFTLVLATLWGARFYQPEYFRTVEPFLLLFFVFYVAIGLLFARRQPPDLVGLVDGPLVFATPIVTAFWQARLVADFEYGLAWSALGLGVFYLALAFALFWQAGPNYAALRESYLALGAVFVTLAVPFAFDAEMTTAVWALEGAGLVWVGLRQSRRFFVALGGIAQAAAAAALVVYVGDTFFAGDTIPRRIVNPLALGGALLAVAGWATGYLTLRHAADQERLWVKGDLRLIRGAATLWAWLWWMLTGIYEIGRFAPDAYIALGILLFLTLSTGVGEFVGARLRWSELRWPALLLWVPMLLVGIWTVLVDEVGLVADGGWIVWPIALAVHYWTLYRHDQAKRLRFYHPLSLWLIVLLGTLELQRIVWEWAGAARIWKQLAWAVMPLLAVLAVTLLGPRLPWPTGRHIALYLRVALTPLVVILLAWSVWVNLTYDGTSTPLPYLPWLNPFGLIQALVLAGVFLWLRGLAACGVPLTALMPWRVALGALLFLWINAELARIVHQFWDVPFTAQALLRSELLQTIYSILWTLLAMALMFTGARRMRRWVWLIGAGLLALTVLKLFVIDLSGTGTLARIVSFIVVGLLMLLIGYIAPIPPAPPRDRAADAV